MIHLFVYFSSSKGREKYILIPGKGLQSSQYKVYIYIYWLGMQDSTCYKGISSCWIHGKFKNKYRFPCNRVIVVFNVL